MAFIRRTGGDDFPDKLKAMVVGHPKSGKTTLLGTIPNLIIADTEPHANNLASLAHLDVPYVTINSSTDLQELRLVLSNDSLRAQAAASVGLPSIDAVAIDTMDTLQKILKKERLEDRRGKWDRDDWAWLKTEMGKIVEAFTALPLHVVFTVHLKTEEKGRGDDKFQTYLPGLEGAIAGDIAGMVGYSLLAFRREEVRPDGSKYTAYWLKTEGDEVYDFLGTRVPGGGLPEIIAPDFKTIYDAAMAHRPQSSQQQPEALPIGQQQLPAVTATPATVPQSAPENVTYQQQPPVQTDVQTPPPAAPVQSPGPDSGPVQPAPAPAQQQAPAGPPPSERPNDSDPVNEGALQHVKKVYDGLGLAFPETLLRTKTIGDARQIVMMWRSVQQDYAEGKGTEGKTAQLEMVEYLQSMHLMPSDEDAAAQQEKAVTPKPDGTIDEVKAWVNEASDDVEALKRANHAFELERTGKNRSTLMTWLESKGATHGGVPAQQAPAQPAPAPVQEVQTPVETPAPAPVPEQPQAAPAPVTQEPPAADVPPTEAEAVQNAQEGLGAQVVGIEVTNDATCEECGGPIDDPDIARLAKTRFGKVLDVQHYIAATKA